MESEHQCHIAWRWEIAVPDEPEELTLYLRAVWSIRWAELVALECSGESIRKALEIIKAGKKDGSVYQDPAGLLVKLARRVENATQRASRRRR